MHQITLRGVGNRSSEKRSFLNFTLKNAGPSVDSPKPHLYPAQMLGLDQHLPGYFRCAARVKFFCWMCDGAQCVEAVKKRMGVTIDGARTHWNVALTRRHLRRMIVKPTRGTCPRHCHNLIPCNSTDWRNTMLLRKGASKATVNRHPKLTHIGVQE